MVTLKKSSSALLATILLLNISAKGTMDLSQADSTRLKAFLGVTTIAITGATTKFLTSNDYIKRHSPTFGVTGGELAVVAGSMGGLFSMANVVPEAAQYAWLVPVVYGCAKLTKNKYFNRILQNVPNVGEHIAGQDILETKQHLLDSKSPLYNQELKAALLRNGKALDALHEQYKEKIAEHLDTLELKADWAVIQKNIKYLDQYGRKEKPFEFTAENVGKSDFASSLLVVFFYGPAAIILKKALNYPDCMVNWGGKLVDKAVNLVTKR